MTRIRTLGLVLLLLWISGLHLAVARPDSTQFVHATAYADVDGVRAGDTVHVALVVDINQGYHVQAHVPSSPDYIPTVLTVDPLAGVTVQDTHYPDAEHITLAGDKLNVYSGQPVILLTLQAAPTLAPGSMHLTGTLHYQCCSEQACLPPAKAAFDISIPVVAAGSAVKKVNDRYFTAIPTETPAAAPAPPPMTDSEKASQALGKDIEAGGLVTILAILGIFLQGLALNLTPCVYPLIPITLSFFASQASDDSDPRRQRIRTFALASTYVLGMATTYSLLGVAAALTGHLFGSALQSPVVLLLVAAVFFALSLSMMGVYELTVPSSIASKIESKKGVWGALFMGLFVGIVAAPCVGPFVIALVTLVGSTGNPVLGFWLFFTMAMGMGLPFLILGWFSGSTRMLPRSGAWMVWVKKVLGLIMMGIALFYLRSVIDRVLGSFGHSVFVYILPVFIVLASIWVGFIEGTVAKAPGFVRVKRTVGVVGLLAGCFLLYSAHLSAAVDLSAWLPFNQAALETATRGQQPTVIDFSAKWCTDCTQLDAKTYSDPQVQEALKGFVKLKADLTEDDDPQVKALYKTYDIQGLPTVIFLGSNGQEIKELRLTGFEAPAAFLQRVAKVPQPK